MMQLYTLLFLSLLTPNVHAKSPITLQSNDLQTTLIELYTSEGCSSCPPADNWLSQLKNNPALWQDFIPIAFHVDYWDSIGWKDKLALPDNSKRQNDYKAENKIGFIYTPGFIINGQEWHDWRKQRSFTIQHRPKVGILKTEIYADNIDITYLGAKQTLDFNIVILGFDIHSQIKSGENAGRLLSHNFVALSHNIIKAEDNHVSLKIPDVRINDAQRGIAVWINTPDSLTPIQAVGGWLNN